MTTKQRTLKIARLLKKSMSKTAMPLFNKGEAFGTLGGEAPYGSQPQETLHRLSGELMQRSLDEMLNITRKAGIDREIEARILRLLSDSILKSSEIGSMISTSYHAPSLMWDMEEGSYPPRAKSTRLEGYGSIPETLKRLETPGGWEEEA